LLAKRNFEILFSLISCKGTLGRFVRHMNVSKLGPYGRQEFVPDKGEAGSAAIRCHALQTYTGEQFHIGTEINGGHAEIMWQ
jgi:hypothetical protein